MKPARAGGLHVMRHSTGIAIALIALTAPSGHAQEQQYTVQLGSGIVGRFIERDFDRGAHEITWCAVNPEQPCKIDGAEPVGNFFYVPVTELVGFVVNVGEERVSCDVSRMYDANLENLIRYSPEFVKAEPQGSGEYRILGVFGAEAGSYAVEWYLAGSGCKRLLLDPSEEAVFRMLDRLEPT